MNNYIFVAEKIKIIMLNTISSLFFALYLLIIPIQTSNNTYQPEKIENKKNRTEIFDEYTLNLYDSISNSNIDLELFKKALKGYNKLLQDGSISKNNLLSIIDFRKSANEKRLFIFDLKNKKTVYEEFVAHGVNTGVVFATKFSNKKHSNQSSLGFYITGRTYKGSNGFSLKIHGQEQKFNSNAYQRGVVIHGASYVSEKFIKQNGRLGRSFGCPAIDKNINKEIINYIKQSSCFFIYHPNKEYISQSKFINVDVDSLKINK